MFVRSLAQSVAVLVALGCATLALAQSPPANPARLIEEGLRRETQRLQEQATEPVRDSLRPSEAAPSAAELAAESPCFDIRAVEMQGPSAAEFGWLAREASAYLNRCLGVQGLRQVASAMDAALLRAGYATSKVTLPPQNLAEGTLQVQVHAGRIAKIDAAQGVRWQQAFPVSAGDLLNIRELEQGVEQMNRLPSRTVQTQLEPGEQPDTSIVRILSKSNGPRFRGGATLDNSGSPSLGRPQLGLNLAFDNPTGFNDLVSASFNTNVQNLGVNHRTQSLALNYSIPWGYSLFSVSANTTQFAQRVQLTTAQVVSSGRSHGIEMRWDRIMYRNQSSKLGLFGALSLRRSRSFIDEVELLVQNRRNSFAALGMNYRHLFSRSSLDTELSVRKGMGWFGAEPDYDPAISKGITLRPLIWNASISLDFPRLMSAGGAGEPSSRPIGYRTSVRVQHTKNAALTLDHFSIGSRGTVRGFDGKASLMAEGGVAWRNELTLPMQWGSLPVVGYLGVDVGQVWGTASRQLIGKTLAGMAIGVRSQWRALNLDAAIATPLLKPNGFNTARLAPYVSLSYVF